MCFDDGGHFSQVVPLRPAGNEMRLTYANRNEWCDAVERLRVEECAEQVAAVRGGMGVIVPLDGLALFTAAELETMVCGDADWDVEFLKKNTELRGIHRNDARIGFLWDALGGFSKEERGLFLQFVWGRSRMPSSLPDKFKVDDGGSGFGDGNPNDRLPTASTCFFALHLPAYTEADALKEKLRIRHLERPLHRPRRREPRGGGVGRRGRRRRGGRRLLRRARGLHARPGKRRVVVK